jgi:transcriptional regulator with GAF, ATPase, and Fis domain
MSRLRLFVKSPDAERVYDFEKDEIFVGRDPAVDVELDDRKLSRRHCRFYEAVDGWRVADLESRNGTLLNGTPVLDDRVNEGDRIEIGQAVCTVSFPRGFDAATSGPSSIQSSIKGDPDAIFEPLAPPPKTEVEELRGEVRVLGHLVAVNAKIAELSDEDALLDAILDASVELLGARRGFLLLAADDHVVVRRARRSGHVELEDPSNAMSISVAQLAIREGRSVLTEDAAIDGRFGGMESVVNLGLHSIVCVPLKAQDKTLGVIYVDNAETKGAFGPSDVRHLEVFAAQASVALEQCRARREAKQRRRELLKQSRRIERLNERLRRILRRRTDALKQAREDLLQQADEMGLKYRYDQIVGRSPAMRNVLRLVDRVTDLALPVLVVGESGTGKELIARAIHFNGPRRRARIVGENCAAVPETLMESEFFGYARGAFTGAVKDHPGLFEQADKGTLFLDEVGETSPEMQKKLLRVLEEGEVRRVGGKTSIPVDVRIVSATNRDLTGMLKSGAFREDLYYRLAGVVIELPPLRDRREDIEPLLLHFLAEANPGAAAATRVDPTTVELFTAYDWPGNVRELRNEVRRLVALSEGGPIRPEHLSSRITAYRAPDLEGAQARELRPLVEDLERRVLRGSLLRHGWNKSRAAEELGLSRLGLRKKLERYGMDTEEPPK